MPVALAWSRLMRTRERERRAAETDELRFRIGLYIQARIQYHVGLMREQPPETREEAKKREAVESGRRKPDYSKNEEARKRRDKHDEAMQRALSHPYNFEAFFSLANDATGEGHVFPKPPPEPTPEDRRAYYDRKDAEATNNVISMLKKVKEARRKARQHR